ncbi:MAG: LysR family transcriptional regulator, partial [Rhizobiaceae bacterium]|nr:LysR family transcriptional regulator [Rhizobiaceae bacterium]
LFLAANPGVDVRLAASTDYVRFADGEFDADVVYGSPQGEDIVVLPLGEEVVTPLCAPALAASIAKPADLLEHVLIRSDNKRVRWPDWFEANGLGTPPAHGMSFDRSFLAIAAAVDGVGVALESTRLAQRELARGYLIAPLLGRSVDLRYVGHTLCFPKSGSQRRMARRFADWLLAELGEEPLQEAPEIGESRSSSD